MSVTLSPKPVVAVVGATGLVGDVLLRLFAERDFPLADLVLLASERSSGTRVRWGERSFKVETATARAFIGVDLVFFAATGELSRTLAPEARARGAVVIDKSATFRLDPDVPLVVPEVNPAALLDGEGLFACPNCTTIGLVMALEPIRRVAGLERVAVTTLQAVSGAGRDGLAELERQEEAIGRGENPQASFFPEVLARNALPLCETLEPDGFTTEEEKLLFETRKILGLPELELHATCVRVPVPVGHAASIWVETERPISLEEARSAWDEFPGVTRVEAPTPADAAGADDVLVGRIRAPRTGKGLLFWVVSDNLRKGASLNALQIAEALLPR